MADWEEEEAELEKTLHVTWDRANPPSGHDEPGTQITPKSSIVDEFEYLLPAQSVLW